jgi:hypothetical protein
MSLTLRQLQGEVSRRLGDSAAAIWPVPEVTSYLQAGYRQIATTLPVFWDVLYLENLPRGFSYTQPWERTYLRGPATFDYGVANYTADFERRVAGDERLRYGPANHTSPFEATDGALSRAHATTTIPATADLPATVTALDRVTWDQRGIDALSKRVAEDSDSRYQFTRGEVYGYLWQQDGIRTLRKVRVPAAQADTVTVDGSMGILRRPTDLSTDTVVLGEEEPIGGSWGLPRSLGLGGVTGTSGTWGSPRGVYSGTVTGTWGVPRAQPAFTSYFGLPRRIPGQHPMGAERFGLPRRPYLERTNVRVEHYRQGATFTALTDVCELPDRYALYLRDYAQARCYAREGPGHDPTLAAHFDQRWARGLARILRRVQTVTRERVTVLGGDGAPMMRRPPRPQLPWAYGSRVR